MGPKPNDSVLVRKSRPPMPQSCLVNGTRRAGGPDSWAVQVCLRLSEALFLATVLVLGVQAQLGGCMRLLWVSLPRVVGSDRGPFGAVQPPGNMQQPSGVAAG